MKRYLINKELVSGKIINSGIAGGGEHGKAGRFMPGPVKNIRVS
jgi:hypothetical protein